MLLGVHYLRGLAALLVAYYHLFGYAASAPLAPLAGGAFGVDVFFVISGFVMWVTTDRDGVTPASFLLRRAVRVVPLYWLFTLLLVAIALAAPRLAPHVDVAPMLILKSLLFLPYAAPAAGGDVNHPVLSQGWTLNYEIFFYALFAASLLLRTAWRRALATATALLALVAAGRLLPSGHLLLAIYTDPILVEFLLGMTVGYARRPLGWLGPGVGLALVALGATFLARHGFSHPFPASRLAAFGPGSVLLVAGAVMLEPWLAPRRVAALAALGDASYALYLSHSFTIKLVMVLFAKAAPAALLTAGLVAYAGAAAAVALLAAALVAALVHTWVESPLTAALKASGLPGGLTGWACRRMAGCDGSAAAAVAPGRVE
jgi:exopolysaccharide production protein ExoZ